ncbi:hypothetical protein E4T43_05779 [Aureobasidium subglaciale]|nr:hypothetical protein E4T43_05779 [Aureobasidium subglaciale]
MEVFRKAIWSLFLGKSRLTENYTIFVGRKIVLSYGIRSQSGSRIDCLISSTSIFDSNNGLPAHDYTTGSCQSLSATLLNTPFTGTPSSDESQRLFALFMF